MRMLFVIEAGFKAGLGHLLRCRVLLLEMRRRGHQADLWLHGDETALAGRDWPAETRIFHSDVAAPISAVCQSICEVLAHNRYDWLAIDGYGFFGTSLYEQFAATGVKVLMLDDLADREFKADIVLNQNSACSEIYTDRPIESFRFLLGTQYALIDPVYAANRGIFRDQGELRRLLVTFGGVDRYGRTLRVVDLLSQYTPSLQIVVAVGPYFPFAAEVESRSGGHHVIQVVRNVRDLSELMRQCDLMVTAGGSTVWQACCVGAPMLVLQTIDNQALVVKTLRECGAALCLDVSVRPEENGGILEKEFVEAFRQVADAAVRAGLSANAMRLVDGNGASRVAEVLESWE
ncbi:MAG: UDP-2,4-diacetamido-2,4,6-trideoxy-beta-L-altropyranose hydrolase [Proteobacteria bacterium]|nr:UDP-2,4-diacetamido-2,4,6-trideoxy-beta-L-altropyranose hydrolase [Pseudomonadota bacterium]